MKQKPSKSFEVSRLRAKHNQTSKMVDQVSDKIKNIINSGYEIDEIYKVRLSRVLDLIMRYKPQDLEQEKEFKIMKLLRDLLSFSKSKKSKPNSNQNYYLLAEEAVKILRELRKYDQKIKRLKDENLSEENILNQDIN
jgi:hypothetical protein